ncbi:hypothetical protein [Stackebrandtia nassauensis]|uniref:Uncharacterized protein n=1 Tax=Stackebrandtia nassauensis (strain DSM 44728 / CIP 108903 / NRRL B-16338 / NBRC 102104 / LLR-40K-21) TaxID=446470 RepID=D3Q9K6_STANL|nr:hypothetical protein [Stackebrandtia nassauensis]ADD44552.1 hypothetical protein Snas_4911 [Stackebrandtia nassauensis DSM 44728]
MGEIADSLAGLTISVVSPDNQLAATVRRRREVTVHFRPGSYERYDARTLETQLSQLFTLVMSGYRQGYMSVMEAHDMTVMADASDVDTEAGRIVRRRRDETVALGESAQGMVRAKTRGLSEWRFKIADGALSRLSEEQFTAEIHGAFMNVMADWSRRVRRIHWEVFSPDRVPAAGR